MDTNAVLIICNLIPVLLIVYNLIDGWAKGALYMLVSLVRLFGSYFIARVLSNLAVETLKGIPAIRSAAASLAAGHQDMISQLPGAIQLFMGNSVEITVDTITNWILYAISFILIFIFMMIVFSILLKISLKFNRIPVLGFVNRLIGAVEGLVFGTGLTLILIYIVSFVLRLAGEDVLSDLLLSSWLPVLFRTYF